MRLLSCLGVLILAGSAEAQYLYVDGTVTGGNHDGSTWQHAFHNPQEAIDDAMGNPLITDIIVAHGTYLPPVGSYWNTDQSTCGNTIIDDRTRSFIVPLGRAAAGPPHKILKTPEQISDLRRRTQIMNPLIPGHIVGLVGGWEFRGGASRGRLERLQF